MKITLSLLLLIISSGCFSQTTTTFYFDKGLNIVPEQEAVFQGTGEPDSGLYKLTCYNKVTDKLIFKAHYTDSTFTLFHGLFQSYYVNGIIENEGVYNKSKEEGLWTKRDRNGDLIDSTWYKDGKKIITTYIGYFPDRHVETVISDDIKSNRFRQTLYDESGKIIKVDTTREDNDKVFTKVEIEASFPGGPGAWQRYIMLQIEKNVDEFTNDDYGTCIVKFIVDAAGKVSDVQATTMANSRLAKIAVKAIERGPKWTPAQVNGRYVRAYRLQPVTLINPNS